MNLVRRLGWSAMLATAGCTVYSPMHPPPPRPVVMAVAAPRLVVIAGSDIRYCDGCDEDIFFYLDSWYVYRYGGWYRCATWGAPWVVVERGRLPAAFIRVPPGQFKRRWGRHHPAHDHHPDLDRWAPAPDPEAGGREQENEKEKGKRKGPKRGRGRH